jgi:hypothetical protein
MMKTVRRKHTRRFGKRAFGRKIFGVILQITKREFIHSNGGHSVFALMLILRTQHRDGAFQCP